MLLIIFKDEVEKISFETSLLSPGAAYGEGFHR